MSITDYFHKRWEPSCFRTEAADISSPGMYIYNSQAIRLQYTLSLDTKSNNHLQVVALCQAPFLLDDPNVGMLFSADANKRAKHYLSLTSGGLGIIMFVN